jgi:hypothetical protein
LRSAGSGPPAVRRTGTTRSPANRDHPQS